MTPLGLFDIARTPCAQETGGGSLGVVLFFSFFISLEHCVSFWALTTALGIVPSIRDSDRAVARITVELSRAGSRAGLAVVHLSLVRSRFPGR